MGMQLGWIEMRVQEDGTDQLVYQFETMAEAMEIFHFIREFFPNATFILQPLRQ